MVRDCCDNLYEVHKQVAPGKYFDIEFKAKTGYTE
jgi:hypothetical protein